MKQGSKIQLLASACLIAVLWVAFICFVGKIYNHDIWKWANSRWGYFVVVGLSYIYSQGAFVILFRSKREDKMKPWQLVLFLSVLCGGMILYGFSPFSGEFLYTEKRIWGFIGLGGIASCISSMTYCLFRYRRIYI
jgi:hypothetical protein